MCSRAWTQLKEETEAAAADDLYDVEDASDDGDDDDGDGDDDDDDDAHYDDGNANKQVVF